jgi:FkbM family methyltransferase
MVAKASLRRLLASLGYELRHFSRPYSVAAFVRSMGVDLIVYAGANRGQFGNLMRAGGYRGLIVSFEPVPEVCAELRRIAGGDERWVVRECALGQDPGRRKLGVSRDSVFSSFKKLAPASDVFGNSPQIIAEHWVAVSTVDKEVLEFPGEMIFLKLDTQGFDREVLAGAHGTLVRTVGIQIELSSTPLYDDSWAIPEALEFLSRLGFGLCQVHPVNFTSNDGITGLEFDFILRRVSHLLSP